jgi:hypothetical protein
MSCDLLSVEKAQGTYGDGVGSSQTQRQESGVEKNITTFL